MLTMPPLPGTALGLLRLHATLTTYYTHHAPCPSQGFDIVGLIEESDEYNQTVDGIKTSFDDHFIQVRP